jgi:hypothetical protein
LEGLKVFLAYAFCAGLTELDSGAGIQLFYDITFPIGKLFATVLTYTNACYEGNPIFPLAINLHESKFKSCHQLFWARVVGGKSSDYFFCQSKIFE